MKLVATSRSLLGSALLALVACSPRTPAQPPTNDTQPPATDPGSGDVMGADKVSPAQKLNEGPKLDSQEGIKPAATPGSD